MYIKEIVLFIRNETHNSEEFINKNKIRKKHISVNDMNAGEK